MDKVKFVITDYVHPDLKWEEEQCRKLGVGFAYYQKRFAAPKELIEICADADVILINMAQFNEEVINGLQNCKLLMRLGIGYDNINIETCNKKGIAVSYFPDYCVKEVAEQVVMLILACQRKLCQQVDIVRTVTEDGYRNFMSVAPIYRLHGKTVGIIGFGQIGRTVYRMLQGFGVEFLFNDPYLPVETKQEYGIETVPLEMVLKESDVITIHVPLKLAETHHMIDEPQLNMMKETAILINTSRGSIVNLDALHRALNEGKIAHAGIDVYEVEPPKPDLDLLQNKNAICTPHMSWMSVESGWNIRESYIGDVKRFLKRLGPVHQINPQIPVRFE